MATQQELLNQASEICNAEHEGENTAVRVGTMLLNIIEYLGQFMTSTQLETALDQISTDLEEYLAGYATIDKDSGLLDLSQAWFVPLATMGALDDSPEEYTPATGEYFYQNKSGYQIFRKTSGGAAGELAKIGVVYFNKRNGKSYRWDGSAMVELGKESFKPHVIDYYTPIPFADMTIGQSFFYTTQSGIRRLAVKTGTDTTWPFDPDPDCIYCFRDTKKTMIWNSSSRTWDQVGGSDSAPVNDLVTGGRDKALSAEMGKRLKQEIDKAYTNAADTVPGEEDISFSNIVVGMRKAGLGLAKDGSATKRATIDHVFSRTELLDVFKLVCPEGYSCVVHGVEQDGTSMLTGFYATEWSTDVETAWSVNGVDSRYQYFAINFMASGDTVLTTTDLSVLKDGFKLRKHVTRTTLPVIEIVGESGVAVKNLFCKGESDKTSIYTKEAVDALVSSAGAGGAYTNIPSGDVITEEIHRSISYYGMSFVRGQRHSQTNATYGNYTFNDIDTKGTAGSSRLTSSGVFEVENFGNTVKFFVPAGWNMNIRQSKSLASNDGNDDLMSDTIYEGGSTGVLATWVLNQEYPYWAFWCRKSDNSVISDSDISSLTEAFYFVDTVEHYSDEPAIKIIGLNGIVKNIFNASDASSVQLYTKEAVDALIGGASKRIRVLQYNIGHFSLGTDYNTNITSANYDEMLARWKKRIKDIDADIIGLPEYNYVFGNNGTTNVRTENTGIFSGYNISVRSNGSGYWINALASRYPMTDVGDHDLGSLANAQQAYARYATININGIPVKIVATHLNWSYNQVRMESRTVEIKNLIKWLDNEPYVILMGDFNTDGQIVNYDAKTEDEYMSGANEFDPFLYGFTEDGTTYQGGFTLANHGIWGDLKTANATGSRPDTVTELKPFMNRPFAAIDNIIVRGFRMDNVLVIDDGHLSDHCALMCDLTLMEP